MDSLQSQALPARYVFAVRHRQDLELALAVVQAGGWTWQPMTETRDAARARMIADIDAQLDHHAQQLETDHADRLGAVPGKRELVHFDWLALRQVRGLSYAAIGRDACRGTQTVTDATKAVAKLIDLPLRPDNPGGRPRKPRV